MKNLKILAFLCLAISLSACANFQDSVSNTIDQLSDMGVSSPPTSLKGKPLPERLVEEGECPTVEVMPELGSFYDLRPANKFGEQPTFANKSEITIAGSQCSYGPKSVTVDVRIAFTGAPGPIANAAPSYQYPYFVAILSGGDQIQAKKVFSQTLTYGPEQHPVTYTKLRQIIPIYNQKDGSSHKVVIGFQLSGPQLDYNRNLIKEKEAKEKAYLIQQNNYLRVHSPEQSGQQPAPVITKPAPGTSPDDNGPLILAPQDDTPGKSGQSNRDNQ